jgi:short-subunit dehydrogenase
MHFKDKVIWITGASSGIGKELAIQLAKQQATLVLTARNEQALNELKLQLGNQVNTIHILPFDLLQIDSLATLTQNAIALEGKIDFVILSAGISQREVAKYTSMHVHQTLMAINYFAPVAIIQELIPHFEKNKSGHITVISSVAGLIGFPLRSGYSASKHAIKGYVETLQTELLQTSISSLLVFPGRIDTPISKNALTGTGKAMNKEDANNKVGMDVALCVSKIINAIQNKKKSVYIGFPERVLFWIWWFLPSLYFKIAHKKGLQN